MMRWNNGDRNADGWKKIREKLEDTKWLVFIVFAMVAVSRLLIYLNFLIWSGRNSFDGGFFDALSIYDTAWYKSIIGDGYWAEPRWGDQGDSANWAFFPFYPLLIRGIHAILPFDYDLLAFFVNSVFFAFALVLAVKYILFTREDWLHALVFVFLMAFGVYNFYFSLLYTEAPFLFFVIAFFYCMERKRYLWMGVAGAFASGTRNLGIMLVFPLAAHYLAEYFGSNRFRLKTFFGNFFGNVRLVLGTVLIPFGFFSYMLHLYFRVGDSLAFVHIERSWGKGDLTFSGPLEFFGECGQFCFLPVALGRVGNLLCMASVVPQTLGGIRHGIPCGHDSLVCQRHRRTEVSDGVFRPAFGIYGRDGEMAEKPDFCTMHIQPCAG